MPFLYIESGQRYPMKSGKFSISARLRSFKYASKGFWWMIRDEHNSWIYVGVTVILIPVCFLLTLSRLEWALITLCIGLVYVMEMINSAIERLADKISPGHDPVIGQIKDLAAGAVLMTAITAAIVALLILVPKFLAFL